MRQFLMSLLILSPQSVLDADYDYTRAQNRAIEKDQFLVTWVGEPPAFEMDNTETAYSSPWADYRSGDVTISGPAADGKRIYYATISRPTRQQVQAALAQAANQLASERSARLKATPFPFPPSSARHDDNLEAAGPWPEGLDRPDDMQRYRRAHYTQSIAVVNDRDSITPVDRGALPEKKWLMSGGLLGFEGFRSDLYRNSTASRAVPFIANIDVLNSLGYIQQNRGWRRVYPDGSRFMDVLSKNGKVFEVRERRKESGVWKSEVIFEDEKARPIGYTGLGLKCSSCHNGTDGPGTGGYAVGLVPGSDTVFSDPFPALEK